MTGVGAQRVFISYSRREFHFAEEAAAVLGARAGLDPWLDVQRLRPGTDWAAALDEGLEQADALLLLVSPAALASAYVRHEWTRALERGIPVHLGVVEAAVLPQELAGLPVHDLRTRFWDRTAGLAVAIASGRAEPGGSAPLPSRWGWPRMPVPVLAVFLLLVVTTAVLGWAFALLAVTDVRITGLTFDPFGGTGWTRQSALLALRQKYWLTMLFLFTGLTAMVFAALTGVVLAGAGLPRRRSRSSALLFAFTSAAGSALALGYVAQVVVGTVPLPGLPDHVFLDRSLRYELYAIPPEVAGALETITVLLVVVVLCGLAGTALVLRSRVLRLWLPTGSGTRRTRLPPMTRAEHRELLAGWPAYHEALPADRKGRNPWLVLTQFLAQRGVPSESRDGPSVGVRCLAPADEPVADEIRAACLRAGLTTSSSPRWTLVLVSAQVPWEEAAEAIRSLGSGAIGVLLDPLVLPADDEDLRRHQWLDFRERRSDTLLFLLSSLRSPAAAAVEDGMAPTPLVPNRFLAPPEVRAFLQYGRTLPAFAAAFAVVYLAFHPSAWQSAVLCALAALLVWRHTALNRGVVTRRCTATAFRRGYWSAWLLFALWTGVAVSLLWTPVDGVQPGRGNPAVLYPIALVLLVVLLADTVLFALYLPLRTRWLPLAVAGGPPPRTRTDAWTVFPALTAAAGAMAAMSVHLVGLP
ncbi:toll/interleukin-1 receptor domain-containing protein [Lentzea chajnantorensis]